MLTEWSNRQLHAKCYTREDLDKALKLAYFTYTVTYPEERYTSYGGQPEEGIWVCTTCRVEWGDEHQDDCYDKTAFEAVQAFIERGL